jgi:hypothetical protein
MSSQPTAAGPQEPSPSPGEGIERTGRRRLINWYVLVAVVAALAIGLVATILRSLQVGPTTTVLASALIFAAASMAAGGLLGLLFGVPRTIERGIQSTTVQTPEAATMPTPGIGANTNLEQISDWLTKIIVGVSLTQLGTIKEGGTRLFNAMAHSLGGGPDAGPFAGGIVVYFSVFGFVGGWLFARLRLGAAMSNADALLSLARRAEQSGDDATAAAAREAAHAALTGAVSPAAPALAEDEPLKLAQRYEELRTLSPGPRRTAELDNIVEKASRLAPQFTPERARRIFQMGSEGMRIVALGLMKGDPGTADLDTVIDAIKNSRSGVEQYHALVLAELMLPSLAEDQQRILLAAIQDPMVQAHIGTDSSRTSVVQRLTKRIQVS